MRINIGFILCLLFSVVYGQQSPLTPFEKKNKFGLQDKTGTIVIDAIFDIKPRLCRGGYWIVAKGGKLQTKPTYSYTGGNWSILDSSGNYITNLQSNNIKDVSEYITSSYFYILNRPALGLFEIETNDGKYGIIDKNGKEIVPPVCDFFKRDGRKEAFANYGFILYSINKKYGVVKLNGEEVLKPEFDCIGKFKDGNDLVKAVAVLQNGKCGLFFHDGTLLPPLYNEIWKYNLVGKQKSEMLVSKNNTNCNFWDGMTLDKFILVVDDNNQYVMTNEGMRIEPEIVSNATSVNSNYIFVRKDNKSGVYSIADKRLIIPYEYESVARYSYYCNFFVAQLNGKYILIDQNNKPITSASFDKEFKPTDTDKYIYNHDHGLCNGSCDSVYVVNENCQLVADKVTKEIRPDPSQNPLAKEIQKLGEDIENQLKKLKQVKCSCCNGSGKDRTTAKTYKTCFKCEGKGYTVWKTRTWSSTYGTEYGTEVSRCDRCGGTGQEVDQETALPCKCCNGIGYKQ